MSSERCQKCNCKLGSLFGARAVTDNDISKHRELGYPIPDKLCYVCLASYREEKDTIKESQTTTPETIKNIASDNTGNMTKTLGILLMVAAGGCFIVGLTIGGVPSYLSYTSSALQYAQAVQIGMIYKALAFSASGFFLIMGSILTAIGINTDKITAQNQEILSLLREYKIKQPCKDAHKEQEINP